MQNDLNDFIYPIKDYVTPKNVAIAGTTFLLLAVCGADPIALILLLGAAYMGYVFYQRAKESSTPAEA